MRIAVLGSVALPVPPPMQGGTEWIAYYQAKGLAKLGHEVTLFAANGSKPGNYKLVTIGGGNTVVGSQNEGKNNPGGFTESSRKLRLENAYLSEVLEYLINNKSQYDIVLNNMRGEAIFLPVMQELGLKFTSVCHLPLFDELANLFKKHNTPVITISNAQRKHYPDLNYLATVYNCVDTEKYEFDTEGSDYMLMVGSIARHKNQHDAINVAKKMGMKLVLAGKINDQEYYKELQKDIDGESIHWIGEMGFEEKLELYQKAKVFVFPIKWEEPFGLVMIEAMACGVPVVAYGNGAIPEVIEDGKTGYVISPELGVEGLARGIEKITSLSEVDYQALRKNCRRRVEEKFTVEKMVRDYEEALKKLDSV